MSYPVKDFEGKKMLFYSIYIILILGVLIGLSGGAIAGIVIACVLIITVVLLVVGYMMGIRSVPKLGTSSSSSPSANKDTFPTPASGFDNVMYSPDSTQKKIQMEPAGSVA